MPVCVESRRRAEVLAGAPGVTGRGRSQSGDQPAKHCSNTFHDLSERGNKDVGH